MEPQTDHDQLFKNLLFHFFFDFLDLFFPQVALKINRSVCEPLDKELFSRKKRRKGVADLAFKTQIDSSEAMIIILVESQAQQETGFPSRFLYYVAGLHLKYKLPVYPIVLFSYDEPKELDSNHYNLVVLDKQVISFYYEVIQLNRLCWRDYASSRNPITAALLAKMNVARSELPEVELICNRLILSSGLPSEEKDILFEFKNQYLVLEEDQFQAYEILLSKLPKSEREGIMGVMGHYERQGYYKGREEGLEEGRKIACSFALHLLEKRFGRLQPALVSMIESLSPEQLEKFGDVIANFDTIEQLDSWLHELRKAT